LARRQYSCVEASTATRIQAEQSHLDDITAGAFGSLLHVRTTLSSLDDIRTTAAHSGKKASEQVPRLRRLLDLAQTVGPDPDKFPPSDPRHPASA
jgi:hypothetical protein